MIHTKKRSKPVGGLEFFSYIDNILKNKDMTYVIVYLLIGVLFAAFVDMAGGVTFKVKEKIGLIVAWPYLLVVGLKEFFNN